MTKMSKDKIVRAAVGSARLDGYKDTLKVASPRKAAPAARPEPKSKATAER
jgi:hypothetical protein